MKYIIKKVPIKWNDNFITGYVIKRKLLFGIYITVSKIFLSRAGAEISLKKKYEK